MTAAKIVDLIYPGFWLALWQGGIVLFYVAMIYRPALMFLEPRTVAEAGLAAFVVGLLVALVIAVISWIDLGLYLTSCQLPWTRFVMLMTAGAVGGFVFVYLAAFWYAWTYSGGQEIGNPLALRIFYAALYLLFFTATLALNLYAIWRFHNRHLLSAAT